MPKIAPPPGLSSTHMLPPNFPRTTVLEIYSPSPVPIVPLLVIISLNSRFFTCGFTPGPVSVSYTHLDVYKRQGQDRAVGELIAGKGSQFDATLVEVFLRVLQDKQRLQKDLADLEE